MQDGALNWVAAGGTADALTATYSPAHTALVDGMICWVRATAANATTTPTFAPDGLTAHAITKFGGSALAAGDIAGNLVEIILRYNLANTRWELLNPAPPAPVALAFTTGDVKATLKTAADSGWVMMNDGTIGDASSGGSNRANADTSALFTLLWTNVSNTNCPVSTGRGVSAAADFAAHKTITLPKMLGRALASAGAGSGLTSRALADTVGEETHALTNAELASHVHGGVPLLSVGSGGTGTGLAWDGASLVNTSADGSGTAHNNVQPTSFLNFMAKL